MHRLVPNVHGALLRFLRNQFKIPTPFSSISPFHSSDEAVGFYPKLDFIFKEVEEIQSLKPTTETKGDTRSKQESSELPQIESKVQISHPWPEWMDLMERLLKTGYFRDKEDPFERGEMGIENSNKIRTACLNFARDRLDLIKYLSRKDIRVVVGSGCPSIDRKVVNSGKRLRSLVGVDEGNVCSSCTLRGSCERAYVKARENERGRTVDVMRILITYGLDPVTGSVENKSCLNKRIKESVRKLLTEMVELSISLESDPVKGTSSLILEHSSQQQKGQINVPMKQGDWVCPKCNFLNFAKNIKCLRCDGLFQEKLMKLREDLDHLPMKKGDWLCDKCNFLNFAKNTKCLQCKEKPTNRQLNPGEWECESCNYVNFKKNMACLRCNFKRPKASKYPEFSAQNQHEDGSFPQAHGMKFVRDDDEAHDQPSIKYKRQHQKDGTNFWRCVEDDLHQVDGSNTWNQFEFQDFPVVGGKSPLSQNPQESQRWKEEMAMRSLYILRQRENIDDLSSGSFKRRLELLESTDDEEIVGWFGQEKRIETGKYKCEPEICRQ
ncbi:uncharacterized protein LOC122655617 isoform X2 [Telopea speciosissima]|uniref:uncharacterized protein LOC122655617 isoform X2 n=1 Tax=Telopea speciosissima TaxID=54955 RepID=UPI001CC75971|nr:uncharacterized protein LOC122655617 isoform X2 [Telopea speciosissima]